MCLKYKILYSVHFVFLRLLNIFKIIKQKSIFWRILRYTHNVIVISYT